MGLAHLTLRPARSARQLPLPKEEVAESQDGISVDLWDRCRGQRADDDGGESRGLCGGLGRSAGLNTRDRGVLFWYRRFYPVLFHLVLTRQ